MPLGFDRGRAVVGHEHPEVAQVGIAGGVEDAVVRGDPRENDGGHLEVLEEQVFDEATTEDHRRIYEIRRDIGRIDRAVSSIAAALRESTDHLEKLTVGGDEIVPYLHDLLDDAAGTAALINNQSRALDAILSSHENNVAARQNQDMRTISAFAALLALPTLVASLYGTNFANLPLADWDYGWVVVAAVMVVVDVVIYLMFKRRHWL